MFGTCCGGCWSFILSYLARLWKTLRGSASPLLGRMRRRTLRVCCSLELLAHGFAAQSDAWLIFTVVANTVALQSTPEGSPAHPSYPSGHSVQNGAFATVLKVGHTTDIW